MEDCFGKEEEGKRLAEGKTIGIGRREEKDLEEAGWTSFPMTRSLTRCGACSREPANGNKRDVE